MFRRKKFSNPRTNALGNGSCAFNAFGSRLFCGDLFEAIERSVNETTTPDVAFATFIDLVSEAAPPDTFEEKNWQNVRNYLISLQAKNPYELQRFLTPILRKLFGTLALKDDTHLNRTIENILASYKNFVDNALKVADRNRVEDDIFSDHPFITEYFKTIFVNDGRYAQYIALKKRDPRSETENARLLQMEDELFAEQQTQIAEWWRTQGYGIFLNRMTEGRLHKWGGDLELYLLAQYFHINLKVNTMGVPYYIYQNFGSIQKTDAPAFAPAVPQLVSRGLINNPEHTDDSYHILEIEPTQILPRLSEVPNYNIVRGFVTRIENLNISLKGQPVPSEWTRDCVQQLQAREVIISRNHGKSFVFNVEADIAKERIVEVPNKEAIADQLEQHLVDNVTMDITHDGGHYDYEPPEVKPLIEPSDQHDEVHEEQAPLQLPEQVVVKMSQPDHDVKEVTEALVNFKALEPDQEQWETTVKGALKKLTIEQENSGEWVKYSIFSASQQIAALTNQEGFSAPLKKGYVSRAEQIDLDEIYARALQKKLS